MNRQGRPLHALAGHAVDLYRLAAFEVVNPHSLSKFRNLRAVQRRTGAKVLIETGTYLGVTTQRCAPHFEQVHTIEIDPALAQQARAFLAKCANVEVILGDAESELRKLFSERPLQNVLVFLDGHFSGGVTGTADIPEPAVAVLDFLAQHASQISAVVIDDFREFGTQPGWPFKWQLIKTAEEAFVQKGFRLNVHFDQVLIERLG